MASWLGLDLCLPVLCPVVYDLKVSALLLDREICIVVVQLLVPDQGHDADVGVTEQRLPQVVEAVLVVRPDKSL
jgi:hypothetical protein